jgi:hypothetical protein
MAVDPVDDVDASLEYRAGSIVLRCVGLAGHAEGSGGDEKLETVHLEDPMQEEIAVKATDLVTLTKLRLNIILHCTNSC